MAATEMMEGRKLGRNYWITLSLRLFYSWFVSIVAIWINGWFFHFFYLLAICGNGHDS